MRLGHGTMCYWRFKGEKAYRFGFSTHLGGNMFRMGLWNSDTSHGPIVDEQDVEVKSY